MRPIARMSQCFKSGIAIATLLASSAALAQSVNVTAQPGTATLPDGTTVPMWGYNCGAVVTGSTSTCSALNTNIPTTASTTFGAPWSPIVIRVAAPTDSSGNPQPASLTINLTNNLVFTTSSGTNSVPTSLTIVGQVGGGLGNNGSTSGVTNGTKVPSPIHAPQSVTWAVAGNSSGAQFNPPTQPMRVQSFGTEVPAVAVGSTTAPTALTWSNLQPGTYLLESGTHPSIQGSMGLYGVVIVTAAPAAATSTTNAQVGAAYKGVTYDSDVPVVMSEIDAVQNLAVNTAVTSVGFNENAVVVLRNSLQSVTVVNGGSGYAVGNTVNITGGSGSGATAVVGSVGTGGTITGINVTNSGTGYTSVPQAQMASGSGTGAQLTAVLALQGDVCVGPSGSTSACYPPAVNYNPLYFLMNGVAFDKTNVVASTFQALPAIATPTPLTGSASGKVLVRLVNAGLRMHVPAMVGTATGSPAAGGFALIAEDGNELPGVPRVQSEVFMAAGKTYDVMINGPTVAGAPALPLYDRQLSLSGNAINRDAGMLAYIGVNGAAAPASPATASAKANPDAYTVLPGNTLSVADPSKGLIANDINIYGVRVTTGPTAGTLTLNANGTFTYVPAATWGTSTTTDSFQYCGNNATAGNACAQVTLNIGTPESASVITVGNSHFNSNISTLMTVPPPGVLAYDKDGGGYPLHVAAGSLASTGAMTVSLNADGSFNATATTPGTYTFAYAVQNSQGTLSTTTAKTCTTTANGSGNSTTNGCALVTVTFPAGSGLTVSLIDGSNGQPFADASSGDYRWIIEEDRTFYVDPNCTPNPPPAGCPGATGGIVPTYGTNFHTSDMPFVAQGCTGPLSCEGGQTVYDGNPSSSTFGQHIPAVCDIGNGVCRLDTTGNGHTAVLPGQVALDPTKRYYISVLPGDAANPFAAGYLGAPCAGAPSSTCQIGYGMGGAPIAAGQKTVSVPVQPSPYPPGELSVFVFEDDFPLNGEVDSGGGVDVLAPLEPGLGGFQIHLWDAMGGNGDFTGQMTYDMFNQPLTNGLDGTVDPATGFNACPITQVGVANPGTNSTNGPTGPSGTAADTAGITGMVVTCPKYESDMKTLSPLAGQAVIKNLMPGRFGVIATPAADRIARGEEWLQTNTLDGQKAHDSFIRIGEPEYFQEYGPANFHVTIGFANPAIINARKASVCGGNDIYLPGQGNCNLTITGQVSTERMSRTPDERLYGSGTHDSFYWTQCYVSFGDPDGEDFAFTKCNADGTFTLTGLPQGSWRVTVFDQWNDMLVDGLSTPVALGVASTNNTCPGGNSITFDAKGNATGGTCNIGEIATNQWQANVYTKTFIDDDESGVGTGKDGIPLIPVSVRYRDGSLANNLITDFTGTANFNETFPLFNWYVVETDVTRYKNTGTHSVYDSGGPADGTTGCGPGTPGTTTTHAGYPPCGGSTIGKFLANTAELVSVPTDLRIPGAVYCAGADCSGQSVLNGSSSSASPSSCAPNTNGDGGYTCSNLLSTGRIDPPWFAGTEGYQGFSGENNFLEFGKHPYAAGENGGIKGHVIYASTRPFDDPMMLVQTQWEPLVAHVTINLYQETTATDGTQAPKLTLVDTTTTTSWDDWAQGFRRVDSNGNVLAPGVAGGTLVKSSGSPDGGYETNMSCPGQSTADLFYFTLFQQPMYLDLYNNVQHGNGTQTAPTAIAYDAQFKCYDGLHAFNQLQPAPYDGMYSFPSVTSYSATTGKPVGTNCTICSKTDPATDLYSGIPQLPPGKYVVEVVVPPGYELVKEEDKNILIGDNFIGPAVQQIGGLGNIFIIPDQASVASAYNGTVNGYNANNPQNPTNSLGAVPITGTVPAFPSEPIWPCVGATRIVPDYISLFPQTHQVSPFAGATRNLCDRKEVTLTDQSAVTAKFYVYTSTHKAAKFTGVITDDFTSEFDPFSPQFGEKFSPPNMPISIKDWSGTEISRVYSDQWGDYNGMTYSTWEVNPPNPTGYSPTMMVFCMNDPGTATTPDPLFNSLYSQFCYELPFMPGQTQYLDTPVVPTAAYVGAGYNNPDCAYPDATPAVASVLGDSVTGGSGPWVQKAGNKLTITALGNLPVVNYGYAGPAATQNPFNQKTVSRHYGFGAQCTTPNGTATCTTTSSVTIGGKTATITGWSDTTITVNVPNGVADCPVQQQTLYGAPSAHAQCGELSIVAGNGKTSIDAVTVTIGGKTPTVVTSNAPLSPTSPGAIQEAIDAASPGDLIIVPPGTYQEMLIMWKPVRLQGVGAASSIINANTQPAGKLTPWRVMVNCLFGLNRNGTPIGQNSANGNPTVFDATGQFSCPKNGGQFVTGDTWNAFTATMTSSVQNPQIDRLPLEGIVGWDTTTNGNLAQLLQEPTLMGAYEGAAITVLSKGVYTAGLPGYYGSGSEATFPTGARVLTSRDCTSGSGKNAKNPYPSNFLCNPSSIDGLTLTDSSQGGGGLFVHAWGHNLQIANDRVYNNIGTLSGGINIGQGESPDAYLAGTVNDTDPGSCQTSNIANKQLPFCFDMNVNVHHNLVTANTSIGDELFSGTPAGAGGVSFCTGADNYKFNYNWVCGNMSTGDGGGLAHIGFIYDGDIEHNYILFNQSSNPTIQTNGGGIIVMGAAPDGFLPGTTTECGGTAADADCTPGLPDGTGPGLVINANLLLGNTASSGSGGGLRLQSVNGTEIANFPKRSDQWNDVTVTNNIIVNNVAGWDGGGISLQDALRVNIINNTIASNDTTASAGPLFNTIGAPNASAPNPTKQTTTTTASAPQPAGLVAMQNSPQLIASLPTAAGSLTCPANNPNCGKVSFPYLANDLFWQNRTFYIGVGSGVSNAYQQNLISIFNSAFSGGTAVTGTPPVSQSSTDGTTANGNGLTITGGTGACVTGSQYWDIGFRGDPAPGTAGIGLALAPVESGLTNAAENVGANSATNQIGVNPDLVSQYCNGSRTPPEAAANLTGWWKLSALGWQVPPGISDASVPNPIFNLSPSATVDEGNNWVNLNWGPLSLNNPVSGVLLGNYALAQGSPDIDYIKPASANSGPAGAAYHNAPPTDFFGNPRPAKNSPNIDIGAVEFQPGAVAVAAVAPTSLTFSGVVVGTTSATQTLTLTNSGGAPLTGIGVNVTGPFAQAGGSCGATLAAGANCTITVDFKPTATGPATGQVTITGSVTVTGSPVSLSGTAVAAVTTASLSPTSWAPSQVRNCPGTTLGQILACLFTDPAQAFTLTNTGNVALTVNYALGGTAANVANYNTIGAGCTSGESLAPGATCVVAVQFKPLTSQAKGTKPVTLNFTDAAGTQTATINGNAQ